MNKLTYENVTVGTKLLVKPDKSKEFEEREVIQKSGPSRNNWYCLKMDNGDEYYGLPYVELKVAQ